MSFKKTTVPALMATLLFVPSCGSGTNPASWNSSYYNFKIKDGSLSGVFNPVGFSETEVRSHLAMDCKSGTLASFESAQSGDLISFVAKCKGATKHAGGTTEVQRGADGKVTFEGLYY